MDFATEEKLCRQAHEVWRQVAAEPPCTFGCADRDAASSGGIGHEASGSLHLPDVFALDGGDLLPW